MRIADVITINRSPEEVYSFWQDYENFPKFMLDIESVRITAPGRLHFKTKPHDGESAEWDAEIMEEVPQSRIAWRSAQNAEIQSSGSVRFHSATGGRGTVVSIEMDYTMPIVENIKSKFAKLTGKGPEQRLKMTLLASKQILETGGIVKSEGSIASDHPGQPPADSEMPHIASEFGIEHPAAIE